MKIKPVRFAVTLIFTCIIVAGIISLVLWRGDEKSKDVDNIALFKEALELIRNRYVDKVEDKKLMQSAIDGMLASLDPHSSFMPADSFKEMKVQMSGSFGGIGIEISMKDNKLTIIAPIEDTPGYRAGLKSNDHIFKIDDKPTRGMTINDAVSRMRGAKGTKVTLTVLREGNSQPLSFTIIRDIIQTKSIRTRTVVPGIGYIRIGHFQETTGPEFTKSLNTLREQNGGTLKGLVIDLRNNPGGLLNQAVQVADHFIGEGLSDGLVVYTEGREPASKMKLSTRIGDKEPHYPIVILVNGGSASASEILAGAMQDHKRAIVMGTQTFGKGSVQSVMPMKDNAGLKLTTARYYTPSGRSIQAKGITPDIIVNRLTLAEQKQPAPPSIHEKDLDGSLKPETPPAAPSKEVVPKPAVSAAPVDDELKKDYQLSRAVELLNGLNLMQKIGGTAK